MGTPTIPDAVDRGPSNSSNGYFEAEAEAEGAVHKTNGRSNRNSNRNRNGIHQSQSNTVVKLLRFLFWNGPLLACWILLLVSAFVKELWNGPLEKLLQRFHISEDSSYLGTYNELDHDLTYYHRRCDHRDISTHDANDLLIDPGMTPKERRAIVMTHGAVVMKDVLSESTARELRRYLETRHHEFHSSNLKLPWDELFWDGDGGSRLSLGLGPEDAPIIARAIAEVGSNRQLKKTLEATLGEDPAVVEVSTLSTMHGAEPQGIHTDSDFFGSSVLYTRTFLHSYTMFISLQNTTSRMGATTICPGTHWCADEDLSNLCQCNYIDDDEDEEYPIGYCNTFEASSNGRTGLDVGVLQQGDAMMFNQNVWHRGPRNFDSERKENRAMFIMTFVTRRDYDKGDNRQQGWGTYYYMRHSMWGHLFSDLKTAASGGMDLFRRRIWKAYGLIGASRKGNLPWLEHWARQMANEMDFFRDSELEEFRDVLTEFIAKNRLAEWLFIDDDDSNEDFGWKDYLDLLIESAFNQSKRLYISVAKATAMANVVAFVLYSVYRWIRRGAEGGKSASSGLVNIGHGVSRRFGTILLGHLFVVGIAGMLRHYVLYRAPFFERIHTNSINFKAFPPRDRIGTETLPEELDPVDLLITKQEYDEHRFRMQHPIHPYTYYYEQERNRLEKGMPGYSISSTSIPQDPKPPIQASAFPERYDVLIGSRFDADYLASMNYVLDFHPGTKEWIRLMKEHQLAVNQNKGEDYLTMAVDTIVSKILDTNDGLTPSLLSNEGGVPRRFLKQDHETGWWITMTETEAKAITRRALLALSYPGSVGVPYEHWKQTLADSRFGKNRETALAKRWIPQHIEKIMKELFNENIKASEYKINLYGMRSPEEKEKVVIQEPGRILLPSTGRALLPKSMITGKSASSPSNVPSLPSVSSVRVHLRNQMKGLVTLKLGDHIMYRGTDDRDEIFQATIVSIDANHDELEIQSLRSDDVHENFNDISIWVHIGHVQFYRPGREGDIVWALTSDPDGEDESWKTYEIYFLTPFGRAEIGMTPDYVEKYEDEEDFDDRAIGWDCKNLLLMGNRIPEIRLRQY